STLVVRVIQNAQRAHIDQLADAVAAAGVDDVARSPYGSAFELRAPAAHRRADVKHGFDSFERAFGDLRISQIAVDQVVVGMWDGFAWRSPQPDPQRLAGLLQAPHQCAPQKSAGA